ncbi:hypothetical protein EON63_01390 [archaeon]|nr:MAG: hypothetical protein EON63_01390 [archaeon]
MLFVIHDNLFHTLPSSSTFIHHIPYTIYHTGQGLAGMVVSLSALFTTLGSPPTDLCDDDDLQDDDGECTYTTDFAALAYFLIATLVLATCMVSFVVLKRLPFTRYSVAVYALCSMLCTVWFMVYDV